MNDILIDLNIDKEPYLKELTNDKVINLTGQSGSGKSYYAKQFFGNDDYLVVDTDEILKEHRFAESTGINKEIGTMLRNKYNELPELSENFDLIYTEILNYCKNFNKTVVIDSAVFHCIKDINILKGKVIIMRTSINTCYKRCIERYKSNNPNATIEEIELFAEIKKAIFKWYHYSNDFILKIDKL